jgi:hypothetical protein
MQPKVCRVLNHQERDEVYESVKYRSNRTATFELETGFYESYAWCDACEREDQRFIFVRRVKDDELWGAGLTRQGADWICDELDRSWSEAFPKSPDLSEEAWCALVSRMPRDFWDSHNIYNAPPNGILAAIKSIAR